MNSRTAIGAALCLAITGLPTAAEEPPAPHLVKDIETAGVPVPGLACPASGPCPPVYGSLPSQLTVFGDRLAFVAFDADHGVEPWQSDGTADGTRRLADLVPGEEGSNPCILGAVGGRLLLAAEPAPGHSLPLLVTDGDSVARFHRTSLFCSPLGPEGPLRPAVSGRLVYELGEVRNGEPLERFWQTDGVHKAPLARLCPFRGEPFPDRPCNAYVEQYAVVGDDLYLAVVFELSPIPQGLLGVSFGRLYRLAAGASTLEVVADTCPGQPHFGDFTARDGAVYVVSDCLAALPGRAGLFRIDGEGAELLHERSGAIPRLFSPVAAGGYVYFVAEDFEITVLWRTDGTPEGTEEVLGGFGTSLSRLRALGDRVVFAENGRLRALLPDGTLVDLGVESRNRGIPPLVAAGIAFTGYTPETGFEPWITDGTPEGTRPLGDVAPGSESSFPRNFTQVGGLLFFTAQTEALGHELWAVRVADEVEPPPPPPPPDPPYDAWIESPTFPGFRFQVRIGAPADAPREASPVADCEPDTVCVSGAVPGRPEVYLRMLGPRPNGYLWPTIVRFTPSRVEVWIEQRSTGQVNYYDLPPVGPGDEDLFGRQDRTGFSP